MTTESPVDTERPVRAARGPRPRCRTWRSEALLRMLENVLEVGERPADLVVYASLGKAARDWPSFHAIVRARSRRGGWSRAKPSRLPPTMPAASAKRSAAWISAFDGMQPRTRQVPPSRPFSSSTVSKPTWPVRIAAT